MTKDLVNVVTGHIATFRALFAMLEEITEDDINIIFKKSPEMEKDKSDSDDSKSNSSDSDSDNDSKQKKKTKKQSSGGVTIQAMSGHQTLVAKVKIYASSFKKYFVKDDEFSCWVNIGELNKCLKDVDVVNYELNIIVKSNDNNTLHLVINHKENETRQEIYPIVFVENDKDIPAIPNVDFDLQVDIGTSLFRKICTKAKKFADTIEINCDDKCIIFQYETRSKKPIYISYGNDDDEVKIKKLTTGKKNSEIKETYILNDLLCLKNSSCISNTMTLYLRNKTPLFINYKIVDENGDTPTEISQMLIFLSPNDDYDSIDYYAKTDKLLKEKKAIMVDNE